MNGFENLCTQPSEKISLSNYLDAVIKIDLHNGLEKQFATSNNGLVYLIHSITEHQSPSYNDTLKIDDIN